METYKDMLSSADDWTKQKHPKKVSPLVEANKKEFGS